MSVPLLTRVGGQPPTLREWSRYLTILIKYGYCYAATSLFISNIIDLITWNAPLMLVDLLLLSPAILLLAGVCAAFIVYRRTNSILMSSTAFTVLFSFGFAVGRIAVPVPTLLLFGLFIYDVIFRKNECVPTSEGCYDGTDPGTTASMFLLTCILLFVQWSFWALIFTAGRWTLFGHVDRQCTRENDVLPEECHHGTKTTVGRE